MKTLKIVVIAIVLVLALTLFTVRLTGLEPQFVEVKDLPAHHMIARPGLWLRGELVTTPVTDWSFVDNIPHPGEETNTILIETQTPYLIPHSVRVMPLVRDGQLYIRSHQDRMDMAFPHDKSWTTNVARDPAVRLKIGDKLYDATMVLVANRAEATNILGKSPELWEKGPDGEQHLIGYFHLYRVFQRNVAEFGSPNQ